MTVLTCSWLKDLKGGAFNRAKHAIWDRGTDQEPSSGIWKIQNILCGLITLKLSTHLFTASFLLYVQTMDMSDKSPETTADQKAEKSDSIITITA